LSVWSTT